jgi:acyl carrier protein
MMETGAQFEETIMALIAQGVPGKFKKTRMTKESILQKELGLDSLGLLSLVFRFEELYGLDLAQMGIDVNIAKLKTVGDIIETGRHIISKVPGNGKS